MKLTHILLATALIAVPAAGFAQTANPQMAHAQTPHARRMHAGRMNAGRMHPKMHTIAARKERQQHRIARGVQSGRLNPRETARLEHQEAGINREERGMRAQNNGRLTRQDRHTLTAQLNQESRRIHRDKRHAQRPA